jgi:glycosyltransferase involved in cell wall biosynthesis
LITEHVVPIDKQALKEGGRWSSPRSSSIMQRRLAAMDQHCRACAEQINRGRFDVLLANGCVFFRMPPLARHVKIPRAVYLQEPFRWLYEALPKLPWVAPAHRGWSPRSCRGFVADLFHTHSLRIQMREEITNAEAFDRILVNSLYSRESVLRAYGLDSSVCYLGIDVQQFKPSGEAPEPFVIGLGSLSYAKGPDRAIRAVGNIRASLRPRLIWVGNISDSAYEHDLKKLAAELGVQLSIKVMVTDKELRSLLSRAALLVYTSRLEPFGLAPLEANACGTPVVAIAEGGVRETVESEVNGFLVNDADPAGLARAMERLLADPALSDRLRQQALKNVREKWSMSAAIDRLESSLAALVAERAAAASARPSRGR